MLPSHWLVVVYLGSLAVLLLNAFWTSDSFTGRVNPFDWSLAAFEQIIGNDVYRTIALRTAGMAVLVTVTDVLLAFPIAYYMARVASPRTRRLLVVAVLMPLWASYLVKIFAWRTIFLGNGFLSWVLAPFGSMARATRSSRTRGSCSLHVAALMILRSSRPRACPWLALEARRTSAPRDDIPCALS